MVARQVGAAYDLAAAQFDTEVGPDSGSRKALESWAAFLPGAGRVLDIGCGAGRATRWLESHGFTVLSLDLSIEMLRRTRAGRPGAWAALADMRALPVPPAGFDGVVALFSVTHVAKAEAPAVLAEFRRALKPGGAVLIAVVRGDGDQLEAAEWAGGGVMHFSAYGQQELESTLEAGGFRVTGGHSGASNFHGQLEEHLFVFGRAA